MSRRALWTLVKLAGAAAIIAWLAFSGRLTAAAFAPAARHGGAMLLGLAPLAALPFLGALRWRLLLGGQGFEVPYRRALHLTLVGCAFNCVGIGYVGGDVVKAYYAAGDRPRGQRAEAVATILVDRLLGMFALLVFGLGAVLWRLARGGGEGDMLAAALALGAALTGLVGAYLLTFWRRLREAPWLERLLLRLPGGGVLLRLFRAAALYHRHRGTMLAAAGVSLLIHVANLLFVWQLAAALEMNRVLPGLGPAGFVFAVAAGMAASSIGLPQGIGVGQLTFGALFALQAGEAGMGFGAALATLMQAVKILFETGIGLPAFLAVRSRLAQVRAEIAADREAAGTGDG